MGTSTATDAKKYFGAMKQHRLPFKTATQEDRELIDMAFNKKKADHRKDWLRGFVVRLSLSLDCVLQSKACADDYISIDRM